MNGFGLSAQRAALGNGLSGLNLHEQLTRRFAGVGLGLSGTGMGIGTNPLSNARNRRQAQEGRMRREAEAGDTPVGAVHHIHHHLYEPLPPDERDDEAEPENENIQEARRRRLGR